MVFLLDTNGRQIFTKQAMTECKSPRFSLDEDAARLMHQTEKFLRNRTLDRNLQIFFDNLCGIALWKFLKSQARHPICNPRQDIDHIAGLKFEVGHTSVFAQLKRSHRRWLATVPCGVQE